MTKKDQRRATLSDIFDWIERSNVPSCGWCNRRGCFECQAAHQRIRLAKDAAERSYQVAMHQIQGEITPATEQMLDESFQRGYQAASQQYAHDRARMEAELTRVSNMLAVRTAEPRVEYRQDPMALERARMAGYAAGVQAGRAMATPAAPPPSMNPAQTRADIIKQVLQETEVIGQSNPNMEPAMNALRHRVKKL